MRISDSMYDFLKTISIYVIPSIATLWLTVGQVWDLPYTVEIGTTISAIGVCIAGCIGLSTAAYNKAVREEHEGTNDDE